MTLSQVISQFKKIAACALILTHAATSSYGSIFFIKKFEQINQSPQHLDQINDNFMELCNMDQGFELFVCSDHHYLGDEEQNLQQLRYFVENVLTQEPMHLIIESKFFYGGADYKKISPEVYFHTISQNFLHEPWSFNYSPQDASVTTWIGWHLPLALMAIHHSQELPYSITLTQEQREYIKNNISAEFCDPRLLINNSFENHQEPSAIKDCVEKKFDERIRLSPTKLKNLSAENLTSQFSFSTNNPKSNVFCAQLFDIETLSSIINYVYYPSPEPRKKKIGVMCGDWHADNLYNILPKLNFIDSGKATGISSNIIKQLNSTLYSSKNTNSRISVQMAYNLSIMLGFINNQLIQYPPQEAKRKINFDGF